MLSFLKKLSVSLAVLVVLLLVGEVLARALTDTEPPVAIRDPDVGGRFISNFEGDVWDHEALRKVPLRFNDLGFRGPSYALEAAPDVRRVAVLGDSMIAAVSVDERDTLAGRLQAHLSASHPDVTWEVMNWGVLGSSTGQELVLYRELVRRYSPDLVAVGFFTGNDLADNNAAMTTNPRIYFDLDDEGQLEQRPFRVSRAKLSMFLNRNSRLYVWQKNRPRLFAADESEPTFWVGYWCLSPDPPADAQRSWKITTKLLETFRDEVRGDGGELSLFVIPCSPQIYEDQLDVQRTLAGERGPELDRDWPAKQLGEICAGLDLPFVSLTPALRAKAPSADSTVEEEWTFHHGGGHWNELGNIAGAERLHAFLTERKGQAPSIVDAIVAR